jgi:hypothetical protein
MEILYISIGGHMDYMDDCVSIGLKELLGANVIDVEKRKHIYNTYDQLDAARMYGRGMTVTRVVPDLPVDRSDIENKIKNKNFELIIWGSIWRSDKYFELANKYYPKNRMALVDGEDHQSLHDYSKYGIPYFKRELANNSLANVFPISFALPTCKVSFCANKIKDYAEISPLFSHTYIYNNESDYYRDYKESRFAFTDKKAGWDCMRHYEIMGNGCIPYFHDIEECPKQTMHNFPKDICNKIKNEIRIYSAKHVYEKYSDEIQTWFLKNNTTEKLAEYLINTIKQN